MTLTTVLITTANRAAFDALDVRKDQYDLIAANDEWLDQALPFEESQTFGLLEDGTPVGMFSLTDTRNAPADAIAAHFQKGCAYLWRFMVDAGAQGRGVGHAALALIEARARLLSDIGMSLTTADRKPGNALAFYTKRGYVPTGRRIDDEIELIKHFAEVPHA